MSALCSSKIAALTVSVAVKVTRAVALRVCSRRIELGIDHVAGDVDVGPLSGEEMRAANPSKRSAAIRTLVGVRELSVIEIIQRAMMKPKQIATAAAAPRGSIASAIRAAC